MPEPADGRDPSGMAARLATLPNSSVTRLYDSACDLLIAARQLHAAADDRDSLPAMAATLGCIHATLDALGQAVDGMRGTAGNELNARAVDDEGSAAVERELAALAAAIRLAQGAADMTRERTAPVLAQLSRS